MMSGSVAVGFRVVRGPAWSWGDQDGGEGHVGTVVEVEEGGRSVVVQWDCGNRCRYRCGEEGKYDLRVFDSAPAGIKHATIVCDWCQTKGLAGSVWRCVRCLDYFLCTLCYLTGKHSLMHEFERIDGKDVKERVLVPWRCSSKRIATRGIFAGAVVIRGHDWRWRDQDGGLGMTGKIVSIIGWHNDSARSVAEVEWTVRPGKWNRYRVGHNGKVDLKCIEAGNGGYYYPEHLPILGAPCEFSGPRHFAAGDAVRVELDIEVLKLLQKGHGGFDDLTFQLLGSTGIVNTVLESGDLLIRYPNNCVFKFNPEAVTKMFIGQNAGYGCAIICTSFLSGFLICNSGVPFYMPGDIVRVLDDITKVHELQQAGPRWVDDMVLSLGLVGRVTKCSPDGNVQVAVGGRRWVFHPLCLIPAPDANLPNNQDEDELDLNARLQMFSIISGEDDPDGIPYAAAAGDVNTMIKHLEKFPGEVDRKILGNAALHIACIDGYVGVLRKLLEYSPNLELLSDCGEGALHLCAYANQDLATEVLLDAGADLNCKDAMERTALMIAAATGHYRVLRVLANHPQVDLHVQDGEGSTALHCAVKAQRNKSVSILLDAGADPSLVNFKCTTSIHDACGYGLLPAMEQFVTRFPQHVNFQKDDGYSPLHVAAANNHPDIVELLVQQNSCNLNLRIHMENLTALHMAVHEGYSVIVELLVGYGADLNAVSNDGNTVLHLAISRKNMKAPCARTPKLQEIQRDLSDDHKGFKIEPYVVVACFLVREGGNMYLKNNNGISPQQLCPSDISALIFTFVQKYGHGSFHGSLRAHCQSSPELPVHRQPRKDLKHYQPTKAPYSSGLSTEPTKYKSSNKNVSRTYKGMDKEAAGTTTVPVQDKDAQMVQNSTGNVGSGEGEPELCCLCEIPVDAKLDPCQHGVMCYHCANKAKRCPTCRVPIQAVTRVQ